jgi:hypothetical protein
MIFEENKRIWPCANSRLSLFYHGRDSITLTYLDNKCLLFFCQEIYITGILFINFVKLFLFGGLFIYKPYAAHYSEELNFANFKRIVWRDFVVYLLVSFDRSEVPTHKERVHLLLKYRFRVEIFDFRVSAQWTYPVSRDELLDFPQLLWSPLRGSCKCCFEDGNCPSPGSFQPRT